MTTSAIFRNDAPAQTSVKSRLTGKTAFTLIELLVVITIIAVLMALLMPALAGARDRAKTAQCANSEKQLGIGWAAFLNDHNGYYPYASAECLFGTNGAADGSTLDPGCGQPYRFVINSSVMCRPPNWQQALAPYIGGQAPVNTYPVAYQKLMQCPANPWPMPLLPNADVVYGGNQFSYQFNNNLLPTTWRCGGYNDCGASPCNPNGWAKRTNINDIQHQANAALILENPVCCGYNSHKAAGGMLVDNPWTEPNGPGSWISGVPMPFPGGVYYGVNPENVTNITGVVDSRVPAMATWMMPNCNYSVSTFHNLGMNVLFFDGHVARVPKTTLCSYTVDVVVGHYGVATPHPNYSAGGLFWTDGVGINGTASNGDYYNIFGGNQFPGYQITP